MSIVYRASLHRQVKQALADIAAANEDGDKTIVADTNVVSNNDDVSEQSTN